MSYDVESDEVEVLCDGTSSQSEFALVKLFVLNTPATVPAVGYTLRATLDSIRNQIYLLTVVYLCVRERDVSFHSVVVLGVEQT